MMLIFCLIISLKITAIYVCCLPGNIFYAPANYIRGKVPYKILKPVFECLCCMASFWGFVFWLFADVDYNPFMVILTVAGINAIIDSIVVHEKISD